MPGSRPRGIFVAARIGLQAWIQNIEEMYRRWWSGFIWFSCICDGRLLIYGRFLCFSKCHSQRCWTLLPSLLSNLYHLYILSEKQTWHETEVSDKNCNKSSFLPLKVSVHLGISTSLKLLDYQQYQTQMASNANPELVISIDF